MHHKLNRYDFYTKSDYMTYLEILKDNHTLDRGGTDQRHISS